MATESTGIIVVRKDHTTLVPNATLSIPFNPSNGPALFSAISSSAPGNVGAPVAAAPANVGAAVLAPGVAPAARPGTQAFVVGISKPTGALLDFGGVAIDDGFNPPPPPAQPTVRLEVFREGNNVPVLVNDRVDIRASSFEITNIPLHPQGFAPESWTARFTNISTRNLQIGGRVLFREQRTLDVTTLPLQLMNRLMRQAVEGLGLKLELDGSTVTLDFSAQVKSLFGLSAVSKDFGFDVFNKVQLSNIRVDLGHGTKAGEPGRFPRIGLIVEFEEDEPEISIDAGVANVDIQISGLRFEIDLLMQNRMVLPGLLGNGRIRGDFPRVPFIASEISIDTDIRFSSRALGIVRESINVFLDIVDVAVTIATLGKARIKDRIPTLREALIDLGQSFAKDFSFSLSNYIQVAIQNIVNRDLDFHGIRSAGDDWQVLTGPIIFAQAPLEPALPPPLPAGDTTPIDGPQPALELENLQRINHIVLLMLENRSYDHVLGHWTHPDFGNNPEYDGLTGNESNQITNIQPDAAPTPMTTTKFFPSPPHEFDPVINQIADGAMSGFGEQFKLALQRANRPGDPRSIMNFHVRDQLRTYDRVVGEFAVAKRWFAPHPGPTFPNRFCSLSGGTPFLNNSEIPREDMGYLELTTIFDLLDEADINWRIYEHDLAFIRILGKHRLNTSHIRPIERFAEDALSGLPPVTFVEPNFVDIPSAGVANDDHPGGADMVNGQNLVARVINAVMASPGWDNTLLVVTYDEHGGFFDHVPPPGSAESTFDGVIKVSPNGPDMLGVRVPAFVVSPRAEAGGILDRIYDHTSVLKSILTRFLPGQEHRLGRHVEKSAHLGGAVPLATPRGAIPNFSLFAQARTTQREIVEPGSFHDRISSVTNPMHLPEAKIKAMTPKL